MAKAKTVAKTPAKKTSAAKPAAAPPPSLPPKGAEEAYNQYLPAAQALSASAVVPFKGNANVVYANVQTAVASVLGQKSEIAAQLPGEDTSVFTSLPSQALALIFATLQTRQGSTRNDALQADLTEAHALRRVVLASAESLAQAGVLPAAKVAQIRAGRGALDVARDLIDLAALFNANAKAVAGKTPVTAAQIARASTLGSQLQGELASGDAPKKAQPSQVSNVRDRFWTLVSQSYDRLWRVGALLFGQGEIDTHVPALLAHAGHGSAAKHAAKTQRAATRATTTATKAAARAAKVKSKGKAAAKPAA